MFCWLAVLCLAVGGQGARPRGVRAEVGHLASHTWHLTPDT